MKISRLPIPLKALRDLGLEQVGLNALYKIGLRIGLFRRTPKITNCQHLHLAKVQVLPITANWNLPSRDSLLSLLGDDGLKMLLAEADEILAGKFRMFGGDLAEINLTPPSLHHWTEYETRNTLHTDLKLIWEPARFGWATVLARAFYLTRDEKYAAAFWKYTETFLSANPPYLGPNWISAQEVAIRILAWAFSWSLFRDAESTTEARARLLAETIVTHAERIPPTLIYARSQHNNHLLSEAAGLVTAALVLPEHPRAAKWLSLGSRWFNRGLEKQIDSYGEYSQHSTNYHRVMLQLALWVGQIGNLTYTPLARKNLERATHWITSMLDPESGGMPNLGANDGAYILPLTVCPFADYRPVVQCAARAFLHYDIPRGIWDEMSLWLGCPPAGRSLEADHYLADSLRGRESWAYLRATEFKSRPGHADLLHLDLWWRGLNIARDAGTVSYNADPPWDNPLTAARVHNTVTVDSRDQMTRISRFLYLDWANAFAHSEIEKDETILRSMTAYHTAWRDLNIQHTRMVRVHADEHWAVHDIVRLPPKKYDWTRVRLYWLFPDWPWKMEFVDEFDPMHFDLQLESPHGWITVRVTFDGMSLGYEGELIVGLVRAGELLYGNAQPAPVEGWYSPTYGQKIPALSFFIELDSIMERGYTTEFIFPK
jgi:hypothetical protein